MIRKLFVEDINGNNREINIYDQNKVVDFVIEDTHFPLSWFRHDGPNNIIEPFVCFVNNKMAIFCNDLSQANYESLSSTEKRYTRFLFSLMMENSYQSNFETYKIKGRVWKIVWRQADVFDMRLNPENKKEVLMSCPNNKTKFEAMTALLANSYHHKILNMVNDYARKMGIVGNMAYTMITEPDKQDRWNGANPFGTPVFCPKTFGTTYTMKDEGTKKYCESASKKHVLMLNPFIYFMTPEEQKLLVVHELTHIYVGNTHKHDAFFWTIFEAYSGNRREDDWSYSEENEIKDTNEYDRLYTQETGNNAWLIEQFLKTINNR